MKHETLNGRIIFLANDLYGTEWELESNDGSVYNTGYIYPFVDLENEDFDFDLLTETISKQSGVDLINDMQYTESGDGYIYWTVGIKWATN